MRKPYSFLLLCMVFLVFIAMNQAWAKGQSEMNIVVPGRIFVDLRADEIKAALRGWAKMFSGHISNDLRINYIVEDDVESIRKGLQAEQIDMVAVLAPVFVELEKTELFYKMRYPVVERNQQEEVLMLAGVNSGINSFDDLEGKTVDVVYDGFMVIAKLWHETLLYERGFRRAEQYHAMVTEHRKASHAVFNVFFGKSDACFVSRSTFDTMVEMNPQVGRALNIVGRSLPLTTFVVAVRESYSSPHLDDVFEAVDRIHESPAGGQIMMFAKFNALIEGNKTFLNSIRSLVNRHEALESSLPDPGR